MTAIALLRPRNVLLDRLRTIQIGVGARGAVGVGLATQRGGSVAAGVDWSQWFEHLWIGKGAVSLSASYNDLVGSQTLTVGAAPTLGSNGWHTTGSQWLDTGINPTSGGSLMVQFANGAESGGQGIVGALIGGYFALGSYWYGDAIYYANGSTESAASPKMLSGNLAFAGLKVYRDGVYSHTMSGWNQAGSGSYYIGGLHTSGGPQFTFSGDIIAVGVTSATLTDQQVADARVAMASLPASVPSWWLAGNAPEPLFVVQPKGASSQSNSYLRLTGAGGYANIDPALVGGSAPTWDAMNGWTGNGTSQWLKTGIVSADNLVLLCRFSNGTAQDQATLMGEAWCSLWPTYWGQHKYVRSWEGLTTGAWLSSGVMAVTPEAAYYNGVSEGAIPSVYSLGRMIGLFAGGDNPAGTSAGSFWAGSIQAAAIWPTSTGHATWIPAVSAAVALI